MEKCNTLGSDPLCDGGESCVQSKTSGKVCFNASNPQQGFTNPDHSYPNPNPNPNPGDEASVYEKEVADLANKSRVENSMGTLILDSLASAVARKHSQDMCNRGYFSHTNLEGMQPWDRMKQAGLSFSASGENIAKGQQTPSQVHSSWMNSSGHRANILNTSFTHIGVGYVPCNNVPLWTQIFFRP
jgi:uncharacterized protein YkwD